MALFGASVADESHAENTINWAIEMVKRIEAINGGLGIRIDISNARVITGIFGSVNKKYYMALSMPVNTAAWLQKLAGPREIIISDTTKSKFDGSTPFRKWGATNFAALSGATPCFKWMRDD